MCKRLRITVRSRCGEVKILTESHKQTNAKALGVTNFISNNPKSIVVKRKTTFPHGLIDLKPESSF